MPGKSMARFLNPWSARREKAAQRIAEVRGRDGDSCARCRRPLRFDLPRGHDLAAKLEQRRASPGPEAEATDNLCLTHERCNVPGQDHTVEVLERLRPRREAELLAKARSRRAA